MTSIYNPDEVGRLIERMQRWEDHAERDGTCVKCGETIGGHEPEHEPSPLCNGCAQDLATRTFPDQLEAARAEIERWKATAIRLDDEKHRAQDEVTRCSAIALENARDRDAALANLARLRAELDTANSARSLAEARADRLDASHRERDATKLRIATRLGLPDTATPSEIAEAVDAVAAERDGMRQEVSEVRDILERHWCLTKGAPLLEHALRIMERLRHDHEEKCSVVVENLKAARAERDRLRAESGQTNQRIAALEAALREACGVIGNMAMVDEEMLARLQAVADGAKP